MEKQKYFTQEDYGREGKFERSFARRIIRTLWSPGKSIIKEVQMTLKSWPIFGGIIDYNFKTQTKPTQKTRLSL